MKRTDRDEGHYRTLWPRWVERIIDAIEGLCPLPNPMPMSTRLMRDNVAPPTITPGPVLTEAQMRELFLDFDLVKRQARRQMEILAAEHKRRTDPYAWFDPKEAMGR